MKQDGSKTEKLIELSDLPTEILDHVAFFLQRIDRNAVLSMSQTSSAMFAGAKHHRSKILLPGLLRRAGIDGENMLKSFDLHQDAIPLDSALLEASIERFGYTMVLLVNDLLERISQVPLMRNPTYIREARELLKRWKNHLFQHCGALGFFLAISYEYNNLTRSGTSGITHYPDHA